MVEGTPPGDALPPPPQRATPARKGARCGAGAGFPRPHRPHPEHTGRGTPAAQPRGRAVGGGTAPDTRRPSQRWQATPPGDGPPPPPPHAAPTGHAGQGGSDGPPQPHARAHSTWVADPNSPPSRWAVGGGGAPHLRRPSQWWKAPPPGTPFLHPHSEQRRPARAHAVKPCWVPTPAPTAPGTHGLRNPGRPPQRTGGRGRDSACHQTPLTTAEGHPPGDGPPPPPRQAPTTGHAGQGDSVGPPHPHARAHSTWVVDPNSPPSGRAVGGGGAPDIRCPSQWWKAPPPGTPFRHPHSEQRQPAREHAVGPVLGPQARTDRTRNTQVAVPRLPSPEDGRSGEGQRLTPDAPHNGGRPPPPGTAPRHPRRTQPPQGMRAKGAVMGPHSHKPAPTARGWRTPTAHPVGGQSGEGERPTSDAPDNGGRHPPPGTPFSHPQSEQRRPARAHAVKPCWVPTPALTAPGTHGSRNRGRPPQRTGGRGRDSACHQTPPTTAEGHPPGDGPPPPPRQAPTTGHAGQGDSVGPSHPHARAHSTWVVDPNSPPSGRAVGGGGAPDIRRPSQQWKAPPRGRPSPTPTASNAGPQGRTLWGRCWVPTPALTAPGTHGWRNPGHPPKRAGGWGRVSV